MAGRIISRILTLLVAAAIGAAFGVAGTVAHTSKVFGVPVGIPLAAIGCAAIVIAVRLLTSDRSATTATGLGVVGAVLVLSGQGPGGSVLVPQEGSGIAWIIVIGVLMLLILAWPSLPSRAEVAAGPDRRPTAAIDARPTDSAPAPAAAPTADSTRRLAP